VGLGLIVAVGIGPAGLNAGIGPPLLERRRQTARARRRLTEGGGIDEVQERRDF